MATIEEKLNELIDKFNRHTHVPIGPTGREVNAINPDCRAESLVVPKPEPLPEVEPEAEPTEPEKKKPAKEK